MYSYFIPLFAQRFGATFLDLGIIGTVSSLTYAVVPFFVGHLADGVNPSRLYALSLLLLFATTLALSFSRSVGDIILIRGFGGLGFAVYWPITEILTLDLADRGKRVKEMGLWGVAWGTAYLIGPILGGVIVQEFGFVKLFALSAALVMFAFIQSITVPPYGRRTESHAVNVLDAFHMMRKLLPWYVWVLFYGMLFTIIADIFPGYASSVGISAILIGSLFTVFGLARVSGYAASERLLRFGERRVLVFVSLLMAASCLAVAFYPTFSAFLPVIVIFGGCFAVGFALSIGLVSRHFLDEQAGAAVGSFEAVDGLGNAIGPVFVGFVAAVSMVQLGFISASFFAFAMVIIAAAGKTYA
jgi:MFS family permease